jgi:hypothetical protein
MTSETANDLLPIPATLDEAITRLLKLCPPETREDVLYNGGQVAHYHSGFGRSLRNTWGLWEGICASPLRDFFLNLGVWHADDMSGILLESTFRVLRGDPVDLQGQISDTLNYWKQQGVEPH